MSAGALEASVTLDEVLTVVGAKRVPLAPELAGYLALELAEHADPQVGDLDAKSVFVSEEGTVVLVKPRRERVSGDAEASIRAALGRLLDASGSQTPALAVASKRKHGAGLPALAAELEAALIPVNRAAGRRALARLAREVKRVMLGVGRHTLPPAAPRASLREGGVAPAPQGGPPAPRRPAVSTTFAPDEEPTTTTRSHIPDELLRSATPANWSEMPTTEFAPETRARSPSEADVDSLIAQFGVSGGPEQQHAIDLKAMAGLDPTPPPAPQIGRTPASPRGGESDVEALLAMNSESPVRAGSSAPPARPPPTLGRGRRLDSPPPSAGPGRSRDERQMPTQPSELRKARATLPSAPGASPRRGLGSLIVVAVVAIGAGSYAIGRLRPDLLSRRAPGAAASVSIRATDEVPLACMGTLVVADVPARAEVLLREGQAPVDIPRMPVGARLEFVATAEGYAPKRVVIPAGGGWDTGPDGKPRFEAAVQLDVSRVRPGTNDLWPAGEPGSAVGGEGAPGTVRVVATPRGAEVWMLAGIAPEARIDHLRCDQDIDVLLAGPTTYRKRMRVGAGDFVSEGPGAATSGGTVRVARLSAL